MGSAKSKVSIDLLNEMVNEVIVTNSSRRQVGGGTNQTILYDGIGIANCSIPPDFSGTSSATMQVKMSRPQDVNTRISMESELKKKIDSTAEAALGMMGIGTTTAEQVMNQVRLLQNAFEIDNVIGCPANATQGRSFPIKNFNCTCAAW